MVCPGNSDVRRKLLHTAGFVTRLHQKHSHRGQESNPRPRVWRRRRLKRRQVQKCARGCRMCLVPLIHRQPGLLERHKNARCRSVRGDMGRTVGGAISIQPATAPIRVTRVRRACRGDVSVARARLHGRLLCWLFVTANDACALFTPSRMAASAPAQP